jgi:hypothetical protein
MAPASAQPTSSQGAFHVDWQRGRGHAFQLPVPLVQSPALRGSLPRLEDDDLRHLIVAGPIDTPLTDLGERCVNQRRHIGALGRGSRALFGGHRGTWMDCGCQRSAAMVMRSGPMSSICSIESSCANRTRARLTRLLTVPIRTPQMPAASS